MSKTKLVGPFTQLLTLSQLPIKGALSDEQLLIIPKGGILILDGKIRKVGAFNDLYKEAEQIEEVEVPSVGIPGLVDAHTHICFGGSRANDYALRNAGKSYQLESIHIFCYRMILLISSTFVLKSKISMQR